MGISIHYRGQLNDIGRLEKIRDEVRDIAQTMGWPSVVLDDGQERGEHPSEQKE